MVVDALRYAMHGVILKHRFSYMICVDRAGTYRPQANYDSLKNNKIRYTKYIL